MHGILSRICLLLILLIKYNNAYSQNQLPQNTLFTEAFAWSQLDFAFPSQYHRQDAIWTGLYVPKNIAPVGIAVDKHRVFISMPRWRSGVPASLATVTLPTNTSFGALLQPYPSWSWHKPGECQGITSNFRVKIDECRRLWVIDTGAINTFDDFQQICPSQVLVFDLTTDTLIYRYRFPQNVLKQESLITNIEVEYPDNECGGYLGPNGAVIYVTDTTNFALIVADLRGNTEAWRITDKTMYPSPEAGTFIVGKETFELMDGVISLSLSPRATKPNRLLFYHAMSSFRQRWVPTNVLRNSSTALGHNPLAFRTATVPRSTQVAAAGMDQNGVMFFGLIVNNAIACWNTFKPYTANNIVTLSQDDQALQFITTTQVDNDGRVWALSTRLQSFVLETLDPKDINFRVVMAPSSDYLVRGTPCEHSSK